MRTISALWRILFFGLVCLTAAAEDLSVSPTNTLSFDGLPGGPFIPATWDLTLSNAGVATLNWSLANTASWLSASPSSGSLEPGGAAPVIVSLTSTASNLPFGNYTASIWFTNLNDNFAQSVPFTLTVDLVQNGGFETGDFTDWTMTNDPTTTLVENTNYIFAPSFSPNSGNYYALFGQQAEEGLAYATQTIQTIPGQLYQISFWVNCDAVAPNPNAFLFSWNGQTLFSNQFTSTNFTQSVWSNFQFTVTATSNNTVIVFGGANNDSYTGLDDVSVQPFVVPPLVIQSVSKSGSSLQLTWNSMSGVVYQLQYNTNLGGTNWMNIGGSITATTSTASTSTPITNYPQGFYRLQQLP